MYMSINTPTVCMMLAAATPELHVFIVPLNLNVDSTKLALKRFCKFAMQRMPTFHTGRWTSIYERASGWK